VRLVRGDAPLARRLAVAGAAILPLLFRWLRTYSDTARLLFAPSPLSATFATPCPACGSTRALLSLVQGHPTAALAANPLVTVLVVGFSLWMLGGALVTVVPVWRRRIEASPSEWRRLALASLVVVAANWAWLLGRASS